MTGKPNRVSMKATLGQLAEAIIPIKQNSPCTFQYCNLYSKINYLVDVKNISQPTQYVFKSINFNYSNNIPFHSGYLFTLSDFTTVAIQICMRERGRGILLCGENCFCQLAQSGLHWDPVRFACQLFPLTTHLLTFVSQPPQGVIEKQLNH